MHSARVDDRRQVVVSFCYKTFYIRILADHEKYV